MTTNTSGMFSLNIKDVLKGLVMAVLSGVLLPLGAILQTPGFNILQANWSQVGSIALTGAVTGLIAYLIKNYFSNSQGAVLGKVG